MKSFEKILSEVETGDEVIVDAVHRTVIVRPTTAELEHYGAEAARYEAFEKEIHKEHALPAVTRDGLHVALRANVAISEELPGVRKHWARRHGSFQPFVGMVKLLAWYYYHPCPRRGGFVTGPVVTICVWQ